MNEKPDEILKKYEILYLHSKSVYSEENGRALTIENKAANYLSVLTLILGAFAFFVDAVIEKIIPPAGIIDWVLIVIVLVLLALLVIAWNLLFIVWSVKDWCRLPINLDFFQKNRLIDIYYHCSKSLEKAVEQNEQTSNKMVSKLRCSFKIMRISVLLLVLFCICFGMRSWIYSNNIKPVERTHQLKDDNKKGNSSDTQGSAPNPNEPDTSIESPKLEIISNSEDQNKTEHR